MNQYNTRLQVRTHTCCTFTHATRTTHSHMAQEIGTQPDWDLCIDMAQEVDRESPKRKADADANVPAAKQRAEEPPPKEIVNLMPHNFNLYDENDTLIGTVYHAAFVLRTENVYEPTRSTLTFDSITLPSGEDVPQQLKAEDVEKLAQYKGYTIIASRVAAETLAQRVKDKFDPFGFYVLSPDSAPDSAIRNGPSKKEGDIIGVRRVLRWGWC